MTEVIGFLRYLPAHRVLICTICHYAIQPTAVSSHLKDIHHIYRKERQKLLLYASSLDLANPHDVILPAPHKEPVPFLRVEQGLSCRAAHCNHFCVTLKRMKAHWGTAHKVVNLQGDGWRQVHLQTFFRGNQLRYFQVEPGQTQLPNLGVQKVGIEESVIMETSICSLMKIDEVDFFNHFMSSTYLDLGHDEETIEAWRSLVPQLAVRVPFLYHGAIACAALHLAYIHPEAKSQYHVLAAHHQSEALPTFLRAVGSTNEDNSIATLAFSQLLVVYSCLADAQNDNLLLVEGVSCLGFPDWLRVIQRSYAISRELWQNIRIRPFNSIISMKEQLLQSNGEGIESLHPKHAEQIRRLGALIHIPFTLPSNPETDKLRHIYGVAYLQLARAFNQTHMLKSGITLWSVVYLWPAQLSQDFLNMLADLHPWALILWAHYCILLKPLDDHWYMRGFRTSMVGRIRRKLDVKWWKWVEWPIEETSIMPTE